ncbi:hypothetical protein NLY43_07670 [Mesorhizobium sp. C416B]|uniref:hypothetical protein n=1 Tax=unclassified Mesorhizobium TaxID=325217 RepID=UPI0003CF3143|nr:MULTISPECIES: hypothetical protein [unclassified Mesorhizobium]ESX51954.1 hypothetical protein X762_00555 [Mesorhizobium sp. LSHC426A00]ESX59132.1 hypothetical protein X761_04255 [Mesorhizobium sp. LSHC424B00]ESX68592.1 hypothetical protein X758_21830 [Mesorhizobium sp. LSHC416B00]WJI64625.1 hypothetical protein NLY43_07670 [Mesorhizobium sp. C416B]
MRTPPLLPAFGKLCVKPPVAIAAAPALSKRTVALRMREILSMHGGLALKLSVVAWTILILAAAFFMSRA